MIFRPGNMTVETLPATPLPELLNRQGIILKHTSRFYEEIPPNTLRLWCHIYARYGIPTVELLGWLRNYIGNRKAIEIGSGTGDLARHLGIPATDNRMQEWPEIRAYYHALQQPVIHYPSWVEALDALDAVRKYKPDIVIGSWITQWISPLEAPPEGGGSVYGVREADMLNLGVTYIMIGNEDLHGRKEILKLPHKTYRFRFLRSRAVDPSKNLIYVWERAN
jgi:hypothetical protein